MRIRSTILAGIALALLVSGAQPLSAEEKPAKPDPLQVTYYFIPG
jgi:hypothetical protein